MKKRITYKLPDRGASKLKVGAWYSIEYGFFRKNVCIIKMQDGLVLLEHPDWLLSDAKWMTTVEFFSPMHSPIFLGYGKPRRIGGWIRRTFDCFCTLYTKPQP